MANLYFNAVDELIKEDIDHFSSSDSTSNPRSCSTADSQPLRRATGNLEQWKPPDIPDAIYDIYADCFCRVLITPSAQKRYIQKFSKKHGRNWESSFNSLCKMIERIEAWLPSGKMRVIQAVEGHKLIKIYFPITGSNRSARDSGYRCIVHFATKSREAQILLVYSKNEINSPNELAKIKNRLRRDHKHLCRFFNLEPA